MKTDSPAETRNFAILLALAGWLDVLDDIYGGLCHDVAGRSATLEGFAQLLDLGQPNAPELLSVIRSETVRLSATVQVLRSLSGKVDTTAEPLLASSMVNDAVTLHRKHRGLETLQTHTRVADGLPPVRASEPRLLRVLLVVLSHAGQAALDAGVRDMHFVADQEDGQVAFRVSWRPTETEAPPWIPTSLEVVADPLREVLAADGGTLVLESGQATVSLPAMVRAGD